jgi:hypothetical protein
MLAQVAHFTAGPAKWGRIEELFRDWKGSDRPDAHKVKDAQLFRNHNTGRCTVIITVPDAEALSNFSGSAKSREIENELKGLVGNLELYEAEVLS